MLRMVTMTFAFVLSLSVAASAIDFTEVLKDLDGKPIKHESGELTLGEAATIALLAPYQDEQAKGDTKAKRFLLAIKVRQATDVKLTAEEVKEIKDVVAKAFAPLVVGRVWEIIDPAAMEKK